MKFMFKCLKNYKKEAIIGPFFKLLEAIFELIVPLVMASIIDIGIKNNDKDYILKMGIILIILGVVGLMSSLTCQFLASKAGVGAGTEIRMNLFKKVNSFSHAEIDEFGSSSLEMRITSDCNQVQYGIQMIIRLGVRAPFIIIGATIMSFLIDVKLAIIFIIATPLIGLVLYLIMSKSVPFYKTIQTKLDDVTKSVKENLTGIRQVRAFANESLEREKFNRRSNEYTSASINISKISSLLTPIVQIVVNIAIVLIIWFGAWQVNSDAISQGELVALINYMTQIMVALFAFANLVVTFTKATASAHRIEEVMNVNTSIINGNEKEVIKNNVLIRFDNVSFAYKDSKKNTLSNINFHIKRGDEIGIIGGTGSGKSTLINLILRFYDTTYGKIYYNNKDIREYDLETLRNNISLVPQNSVLFKGTIMDNIKWGKKDATQEEIDEALELAEAKKFVYALPDNLLYQVEEKGQNLSGGQRQRLTIARALVSKRELLILDDSSSALDYATDKKIRDNIKNNLKDTTKIIISQRATSIKHVEMILVLDNGIIVGCGKHDDLIKTCDVYREICLSQLSESEVLK